jgi:hypothetical protein
MSKRSRRPGSGLSRRGFLSGAAGLGGMMLAGGTLAGAAGKTKAGSPENDPVSRAYQVRLRAAEHSRDQGSGRLRPNGDEQRLGHLACYSKGLPHDARGEVDPKATTCSSRPCARAFRRISSASPSAAS